MRKERLVYVQSIKLRLSIRTALSVTRSLESSAKDVTSPSHQRSIEQEEWVRVVGTKGANHT